MEIKQVIDLFLKRYGGTEEGIRVFASPGRVNLIGEHTDYNGGFVFPAAISMRSLIVLRPREDDIIRLSATDLEVVVEAEINKLNDYRDLKWGNWVWLTNYSRTVIPYKAVICCMMIRYPWEAGFPLLRQFR